MSLNCVSLCDPMYYTVHGIFQARILEWVAFRLSRGSSQPSSPHCRQILCQLSHQGSPRILEWVAYPFSRGSSQPGIEPGPPALQMDSLPTELSGKPKLLTSQLFLIAYAKRTDFAISKEILFQPIFSRV